MVKTKSVHSPIEPAKDGLRILASRFRGRGLPANRYDVWMPNLGPSERLLRSFLAGKLTWTQFSRRYQAELFESAAFDRQNALIKNHGQKFTLRLLQTLAARQDITILCQCSEATSHCHRFLLEKILSRKI